MKDINVYFADKCGVAISYTTKKCIGENSSKLQINGVFWTIKDPRCREICREKFRIVTNCDEVTGLSNDKYEWEAEACVQHSDHISCKTGYGQTISEAEIDLLTRIYKAEKEL